MTDDSTDLLDKIKSMIRRRGTPADPTVDRIVAEVRSQDVLPVQQPDPNLTMYAAGSFLVEWTYGVPYAKIKDFHDFLNKNDQSISDSCDLVTPGKVRYLGTWWVFGVGPSTYRTLWLYDKPDTIQSLELALQASPNFMNAIVELRSYWAQDPGRAEQQYQPAALFTDPTAGTAPHSFANVTAKTAP
jgi:hypothetical protein